MTHADPWAEVERLVEIAKASTFVVGDIWFSPGCHRYKVVDVTPEGTATLHRDEAGWLRPVVMRWNSPKLDRWKMVERPVAMPHDDEEDDEEEDEP